MIVPVTVVIPTYRAEATIVRAVDSAVTQIGVRAQVIVVEDGRFDATAECVGTRSDVEVVLLERNHGAPHARNVGLNLADTEFVSFLDADDYLEGPILYDLATQLECTGAAVAMGPQKKVLESGREFIYRPPELEDPTDVVVRWLSGQAGPGVNSIMWRTEELRRIGGWNEALRKNQDGELVVRAMLNRLRVCYSREGFGVYTMHSRPSVRKTAEGAAYTTYRAFAEFVDRAVPQDDQRRPRIAKALQAFRALRAISAFIGGDIETGRAWEAEWRANGPPVYPQGSAMRYRMVSALSPLIGLERAARLTGVALRVFS